VLDILLRYEICFTARIAVARHRMYVKEKQKTPEKLWHFGGKHEYTLHSLHWKLVYKIRVTVVHDCRSSVFVYGSVFVYSSSLVLYE